MYWLGAAISALDDGLKALFKSIDNIHPAAIVAALPFVVVGGVLICLLIFALGAMEGMNDQSDKFKLIIALSSLGGILFIAASILRK
jgi:hypothetical protein